MFSHPPGVDFVQQLRQPSIWTAVLNAGVSLNAAELREASEDAVVQALNIDFTSLFITPPRAISLNASVHRDNDRSLMGPSAIAVREFIERLGLAIDSGWRGMPDHLAVEFELMSKLAAHEQAVWTVSDSNSANNCRNIQSKFLRTHVHTWVPGLCDQIVVRAETSFYRELALFTTDFIDDEILTLV
jgi:TorA maturation chaperone TorD